MINAFVSVRAQTRGLATAGSDFDTVNIRNVKSTALYYVGHNPD